MNEKIDKTSIIDLNSENSIFNEICDGLSEDENQIPFKILDYQNSHKFISK